MSPRASLVPGAAPAGVGARVVAALAMLGSFGCGGSAAEPLMEDGRPRVVMVELTRLEIRDDNIDRFEHCPPPGDIGQSWFPEPPAWRPAAAASPPETDAFPVGSLGPLGPGGAEAPPPAPRSATLRELVDQAYRLTHPGFRHCYHENLRFDPTQDGRVAVVLRVGATGKVEAVETWGACDLAPEAIACMRDEAKRVTLSAPAGGYATVIVPGLFTEDPGYRRSANEGYTAAVFVAVEALRPQLHRCDDAAKRARQGRFARATMTIDVDAHGRATHVSVDLWKGSQSLLACAGEVLQGATFPRPPGARGRIYAPIAFNPKLERQGLDE